jgi:hypothetical protein
MATPTEAPKRDYLAFVRGPAGVNTVAFGTLDEPRSGVQHAGLILSFPEPSGGGLNDFGFQEASGFTVEIADEVEGGGTLDWYLLQEDVGRILLEDETGSLTMEY